MNASEPIKSPRASDTYDSLSPTEKIEDEASILGLAVALGLRGVEVASATLLALLVCPPLLILVVIVIVPLFATAVLVSLAAAALAAPYLLVRYALGHRGPHAGLLAERLRHAAHAVIDLLPHRIVADARPRSEPR